MILILKLLFWMALSLLSYTYFIYPLILILLNVYKFKPDINNETVLPHVAMVVAAYNEEKIIEEKIINYLRLDYPKDRLEIIIGSDGSSDMTANIVKKYATKGVRLYNFGKRIGKVNILNRIVPGLKAKIIVFSDANTMYEPNAIRELVKHFSNNSIGCVCGRLILNKPNDSYEGEFEGIYWKYETFLKRLESTKSSLLGANGGIYAIRKELFQILPSTTIIEDFVIPMKVLERRYGVIYEPQAIAYEETSRSIEEESKRKARIGAGAYQALLLTLPMLNIFRGFPSFAYWSHKVLRWLVPFSLILLFFLNVLLLGKALYQVLFIIQCVIYTGAFIGYLLSTKKHHLKLFTVLYYFVAMNVSLLVGFFRFFSGMQSVTWERVER